MAAVITVHNAPTATSDIDRVQIDSSPPTNWTCPPNTPIHPGSSYDFGPFGKGTYNVTVTYHDGTTKTKPVVIDLDPSFDNALPPP